MNQIIEVETLNIEDMIYEIRGKQVMLDSDLARLYECINGKNICGPNLGPQVNRIRTMLYAL